MISSQIDEAIQHQMPNADIGIIVIDADSGKLLYQKNSYRAFAPASNMKLFIAAAALYQLGPDYQFTTSILVNPKQLNQNTLNGNLYIKFTGDPSLSIKDLNNLIKKTGIKKINGNVILDNTRYEKPDYAPGLSYDDTFWAFGAPATAIIINQNNVFIKLTPNKTLGKMAKVIPGRYTRFAKFTDHVKTVSNQYADVHCTFNIHTNDNNDIEVSGCWPIQSSSKNFNIALRNPALFAEKLIAAQLKANQINLTGKIMIREKPKQLKVIAEHKSHSLKILIKTLLKDSNNIYAESLTKTLGYDYFKHGNFQTGTEAIKTILLKKADINFNQSAIFDGAGGSRYDLIQPVQLSRLLYVIYHSPKSSKLFISALPNSGLDGTLKNRMRSFDLKKYVQAKTGTMMGISTLSGFLTTKNNHKVIFSIMINHIVGSPRDARYLQNELCNAMINTL